MKNAADLQRFADAQFLEKVPGSAEQLAIPCRDGMVSVEALSDGRYLDGDNPDEVHYAGEVVAEVRLSDGVVTEYHTVATAPQAIAEWADSIAETVGR